MKKIINENKRAQVWIETVLYTLIGLAILGTLMAVAKPKIDSYRDKVVIEQTIESLSLVDEKITSVLRAPGNTRIVDLKISKGKLVIDSQTDTLYWIMESKDKYGEPGQKIPVGNIDVLTEGKGPWMITMSINYTLLDLNITTKDNKDIKQEVAASPTPYSLIIENLGKSSPSSVKQQIRIYTSG